MTLITDLTNLRDLTLITNKIKEVINHTQNLQKLEPIQRRLNISVIM